MKAETQWVAVAQPAGRAPLPSNQLQRLQAEQENKPTSSWWRHADSGKMLTGSVAKSPGAGGATGGEKRRLRRLRSREGAGLLPQGLGLLSRM